MSNPKVEVHRTTLSINGRMINTLSHGELIGVVKNLHSENKTLIDALGDLQQQVVDLELKEEERKKKVIWSDFFLGGACYIIVKGIFEWAIK